MAGVPLASAFIRLRPDPDIKEFEQSGQKAGASFADGFYRDANGKLRQANGRFATDAQKRMVEGGGEAGKGFGTAFNKQGGGVITRGFSKLKNELGPLLIPLGIGGAIAAIGKIGIQYEDNLNIFQAVTKATGKQMDAVSAKARQLGADVNLPGVSAAGAAEAMTELSKAGFTVQQSMDAAQGTLQLARIASISEASASEIAANAVNAFGIQAKDTGFVVDELAAAANSSSVEIKEVSDSFKMAAAVFSGLQGPTVGSKEAITELNTAIAILGNNGIKGSDAGTSLKQALLQLTGPSAQAKDIMRELAFNAANANVPLKLQNDILHGSKKNREVAINQLEKLNPSMQNLGDIAYDSAGRMRPLRDIIDLVSRGTKGMTQEDRNFAITQIFGADASRSLLALLKGGLPVYDKQRKAVMEQGAAAAVAAAKNKGLGGAIDNVKSQLENAAIAIYVAVKGPLTTAVSGLANVLAPLAGGITKFAGFVQDNIGTIRDWAVAIGAVTLALKINSAMLAVQAAGGILKAIQGIGIITRITQGWAAAQALLNATLIANPIGLVIVAITALVAGLILLYRHNETFRKIVQAVWGAIKTAIKATVDWIVNVAWPAIVTAFKAVAAAAMWLWHNVFEPVWHGIMAVVNAVVGAVRVYIQALVTEFKFIASIAMWLWHNIFGPIFGAIRKIIEVWWLAVQIIFKAFTNILQNVVGRAITGLKILFTAVFNYIKNNIVVPWWTGVKAIFNAFRTYIVGPITAVLNAVRAKFVQIFNAISAAVRTWWTNNISPIFASVRRGWDALAAAFSAVYNNKIKPLFNQFVGFIRNTVVAGFRNGVNLITAAWAKVQEAARRPVAFVVNHVINPFINGLNAAARVVGVKDRVAPIKGFQAGGEVPGYATGGRITGAPSATDNRLAPARIPGVGAVKLAGGEYVVNARDTRKALPLLKWVNNGMKGGAGLLSRMLGKPLAELPGDGSEGWAFASGGLVGWTKDVWGALTNPGETIKKPFEALLRQIPGVGHIKDFLIGASRKLLTDALGWITGTGGAVGGSINNTFRAVRARTFVQSQAGKPYVWASAGPGGYDCSGIVSAAYNILKGNNPYSHTFSTESLPGPWFDTRHKIGSLMAGWSHPGQSPASASVGHMAGMIAGMPFESTGSSGVRIGARARKVGQFANTGAARASGGLIDFPPIRLFDNGGLWPSGTLGANLSGRTEYVDPGRGGGTGGRTYQINVTVGPGAHPVEVGRTTVQAIKAFERANGSGWRN
jgi:TP901 family phage tail tape measure protein